MLTEAGRWFIERAPRFRVAIEPRQVIGGQTINWFLHVLHVGVGRGGFGRRGTWFFMAALNRGTKDGEADAGIGWGPDTRREIS